MKMFGEEKGGNLESDCVMAAIESESMPLGIWGSAGQVGWQLVLAPLLWFL